VRTSCPAINHLALRSPLIVLCLEAEVHECMKNIFEHATEYKGQVEVIIQAVKLFVIMKPPKEPHKPERES